MGFEILAGWVVALIVAGLALWFRAQKERAIAVLQSDRAHLQQQLAVQQEAKETLERQHETLRGENEQLRSEAIRQGSRLDAQIEKHTELLKNFDEQRTHLREEMANTMQKLLEGKIKTFDETSMKGLAGLLEPFKENIEGFKKQVQQSQQASAERIAGLSKEIEQVMKAGLNISAEAANLTKALKGEKQTQGRWGEMVLESVLEQSGLIKGEHYRTQESYRDESGHQKRPDVVVRLPQDRSIIIDSKVSLVDYDSFIRAESEADRTLSLRRMVEAFYRHIDTLHSKDYAHYEAGTLQYVFMFVPIEAAYALSVQHDPGLYEYALGKHIVIVYPSTLVVTLKTIYLYWQREASDQAVERIFKEAGALYDKVYGFVENFERIGQQLSTVSTTYEKTARQLYSGSGNLLSRTEKLKTLGAKTTKTLKDLRIKNAELDEDETELLENPKTKE